MTESEYAQLADAFFHRLDQALEATDIDYELATGGILEMDFDDGSRIIVNRQTPMQEIWVAAKSGGFHYRWQDGQWRDTRSGDELFAALERMVSQQAGEAVRLA
ncbi:MAG: iron donor protein CyaY [Hydrogenophilales bacterium CG03_land_8_20_14_0_80_62_28]|nr:iron donor protein CyaY [Betaproteobacteria bacterium]OIO79231.1 MAG: iron donor protein CyaY [Hydrogenophilaceae bacterium CG1_02_62_390]PIV21458.1 MAG: iron donor protein CyaY [Hydrogenophilales bacterium CG03_land_8_20_14_0_80_62_28]PIW39543.1 MAG: iron donor protein CyaY [Hydrogenophilales bacterium CG15_BIG_FIL_POST_REV_8_21_14_020_62_31]PIW71028.1 MAG: iron donor protein CyaY [Hydrogenophilales bacterium CG12_big_fil_rev_8_21_14_0_65_61_21]PIX02683.1 MAG: iron donor protein CyaY [Hydr